MAKSKNTNYDISISDSSDEQSSSPFPTKKKVFTI